MSPTQTHMSLLFLPLQNSWLGNSGENRSWRSRKPLVAKTRSFRGIFLAFWGPPSKIWSHHILSRLQHDTDRATWSWRQGEELYNIQCVSSRQKDTRWRFFLMDCWPVALQCRAFKWSSGRMWTEMIWCWILIKRCSIKVLMSHDHSKGNFLDVCMCRWKQKETEPECKGKPTEHLAQRLMKQHFYSDSCRAAHLNFILQGFFLVVISLSPIIDILSKMIKAFFTNAVHHQVWKVS